MERICFQFCLADVTIGVSCCYPTTMHRCRDYLVQDGIPQLQISITQEDIAAECAYLSGKKNGEPLEASTPEALELLVLCRKAAELLPELHAVLFHGSALAFDGQGILFTAASGTGKSTHTRLWRQEFGARVTMINDDKPFLSLREDGIRVHGSPWRGKHGLGENMSVPVKAIVILTRGEENQIVPITPREALPMLMQQTYQPRQSGALLKTLVMVDQLSRGVSLYRLSCNMDPQAAWVACRGIMNNSEDDKL